jgi:hypothetical protein
MILAVDGKDRGILAKNIQEIKNEIDAAAGYNNNI